jgi:hypothetical protein
VPSPGVGSRKWPASLLQIHPGALNDVGGDFGASAAGRDSFSGRLPNCMMPLQSATVHGFRSPRAGCMERSFHQVSLAESETENVANTLTSEHVTCVAYECGW